MLVFKSSAIRTNQSDCSVEISLINLQLQISKSPNQSLPIHSCPQVPYTKTKTISWLQKMLFLLFLLQAMLQNCYCQSSLPTQFQPLPNIQSAIVGITVTAGLSQNFNYVFSKAKRSTPLHSRTFVAIHQMDYNLNKLVSPGIFNLRLIVNCTLSGTSSLTVTLQTLSGMINTASVSLILFDNDLTFFNEAFQDLGQFYYTASTTGTTSFTVKSSPYATVRFVTHLDVTTMSSINSNIMLNTGFTDLSTSYRINPSLGGSNLDTGFVKIRTLVVYTTLVKNYGLTVLVSDYYLATSPFTFSVAFGNFDASESVYFMGLERFNYAMVDSSTNVGFQWTAVTSFATPKQLAISTTVDDQFLMFSYSYMIISLILCPAGYNVRGTNRTTGSGQCFETCYQNEYVDYDATNNYMKCVVCADPLCRTCDNPTQCSSCVSGYTLVETTQTCTPDVGYYLDVSSVIRACNYSLAGCLNCSTDGATCTLCQDGYYLSGSICATCSGMFLDCGKCNTTSCIDCLVPKVLINGTLCSDPIPSQTIVVPSTPRGPCTDTNCFECSATNVSNCIVCKSNLYILQDGKCNTVCGDSLIDGSDVCDDGNQISFDGCSADCKTLEDGFVCNKVPSQLPGYLTTQCYFGRAINLSIASIEKPLTQNQVHLYLKNSQPKINAWKEMEIHNQLAQAFTLKIPRFDSGVPGYFFNYTASFVKSPELLSKLQLRAENFLPEDFYSQNFRTRRLQSSVTASTFSPEQYEFILLEISYSPDAPGSVPQPGIGKESLNHQTMAISFDPKLSQRSIFTQNVSPLLFTSSFSLKADDNQVIQFYDESYYQKVDQIGFLSMVIGLSCILLMVIGLFSFCVDGRNSKQMLVAVETSFIVQLSYFSLLGVGAMNPMFLSMASGLKYSAGFDVMLDEEGSLTQRYLSGIDVESVGMGSNVNLSFMVIVLCMITGSIMLLLDKFVLGKKLGQNRALTSRPLNEDSLSGEQEGKSEKKQENCDQDKSQKSQNRKDNIIESNRQNEKNEQKKLKNEKLNQSVIENEEEESKCKKFGMFLVFNAGFGFFLFYLYKCLFFTCVQVKYGMGQIGGINVVILGGFIILLIVYIFLLVKKLQLFETFTLKLTGRRYKINTFDTLVKNKEIPSDKIKKIEKKFAVYIENLPMDQKPQILKNNSLQDPSINIKLWYFLVIILEHSINMGVMVFLSSSFLYVNMIPMINYVVMFVLLYKAPVYPSSNLYRLYSGQFVGMAVQAIFLARRILSVDITADDAIGKEQNSLSLYFTISVVILLFLLCAKAYAFSFYGIRRIRCCELQMDWEKIEMNHHLKQKLEKFVIEELTENFNAKINKRPDEQHENENLNQLDQEEDDEYDNLPFMHNESFDNSENRQSLNSPSRIGKNNKDKDGASMAQSPCFKGRRLVKKPLKNMIDFDRPINQEITTHLLKKQIKEKLLNSRLQSKIKRMGGFKDQKFYNSSKGFDSKKSQGWNNSSMLVDSDSGHKVLIANVSQSTQNKANSANSQKIKEMDFMNSILLKNEVQSAKRQEVLTYQEVGYVYTDKKGYDLYEEFDII